MIELIDGNVTSGVRAFEIAMACAVALADTDPLLAAGCAWNAYSAALRDGQHDAAVAASLLMTAIGEAAREDATPWAVIS